MFRSGEKGRGSGKMFVIACYRDVRVSTPNMDQGSGHGPLSFDEMIQVKPESKKVLASWRLF